MKSDTKDRKSAVVNERMPSTFTTATDTDPVAVAGNSSLAFSSRCIEGMQE